MIASYALCGFANFGSLAIQIGGLGGIAPERRGDVARDALRALLAGSLASFIDRGDRRASSTDARLDRRASFEATGRNK